MDAGPLTITAAAEAIRAGKLTPCELLRNCMERVDRYEPRVKAWAYLDRDRAFTEAEKLTAELDAGYNRGPLHGIPIGVKDIIDVFDMPTGCGSKLWANSYARRDATVVERLRLAGAIVLGKTVTTPYAFLDPPPTRNPWNMDRTLGGSSSGSAAAVACGMCLGALGTQTGGSVVRPASFCGVFSLKPTYGRVSVDGVLPLAPTLDHVGVMAHSVRDLAVLLQAVARTDDPGIPAPYHFRSDIDSPAYPKLKQLAQLPEFVSGRIDPVMTEAFDRFRDETRSAGWAWQQLPLPPAFSLVPRHHRILMAVEGSRVHADRLRRHPDDYPDRIRGLIEEGSRRGAVDYADARDHHERLQQEIEASFVDGWHTFAVPAAAGPAPGPETTGDPTPQAPWSYTRLPVVSLPIGRAPDGLPLAVALVGRHWCEDDVLHLAAKLEADLGIEPSLPPVL